MDWLFLGGLLMFAGDSIRDYRKSRSADELVLVALSVGLTTAMALQTYKASALFTGLSAVIAAVGVCGLLYAVSRKTK